MADTDINHERLLRAIRCLQLIQRTNAPKSSIFKAAGKALAPLMQEQSTMPPLPPRVKSPIQQVGARPGNDDPMHSQSEIEGMGGDAILEPTRAGALS